MEPFARQMSEFALLLWAVITFLVVIWYVLRGSLTWRGWFVALVVGNWFAPFSIVAALVVNVLAVWQLPSAGTRRISKFLRPMIERERDDDKVSHEQQFRPRSRHVVQ